MRRLMAVVAALGVVMFSACGDGRPVAVQRPPLLQLAGSGTETTSVFTASGPWSLAWSFDCGSGTGGSFFLDIYNAADHTPDFKNRGVHAEGEQHAADTADFANPGTFYLEITTTCVWTIKVFQ